MSNNGLWLGFLSITLTSVLKAQNNPQAAEEKNSTLSPPSSFASGAIKDIHLKSPTTQADPAPRQYSLQMLSDKEKLPAGGGGGAASDTFKWRGITEAKRMQMAF